MAVADDINANFKRLKAELAGFKGDFVEFKHEITGFMSKTEIRFNKLYELVDGLAGDFRKFDEEQTVLSGRQSEHSDRLEKLEEKAFGHTLP